MVCMNLDFYVQTALDPHLRLCDSTVYAIDLYNLSFNIDYGSRSNSSHPQGYSTSYHHRILRCQNIIPNRTQPHHGRGGH